MNESSRPVVEQIYTSHKTVTDLILALFQATKSLDYCHPRTNEVLQWVIRGPHPCSIDASDLPALPSEGPVFQLVQHQGQCFTLAIRENAQETHHLIRDMMGCHATGFACRTSCTGLIQAGHECISATTVSRNDIISVFRSIKYVEERYRHNGIVHVPAKTSCGCAVTCSSATSDISLLYASTHLKAKSSWIHLLSFPPQQRRTPSLGKPGEGKQFISLQFFHHEHFGGGVLLLQWGISTNESKGKQGKCCFHLIFF